MKVAKAAPMLIGAVSLIGLAMPAVAGVIPDDTTANAIQAEVMPTASESRNALRDAAQRLHQAQFASISSPAAERDYVSAWRAYQIGRFDVAVRNAQAAQNEVPSQPNWLGSVK